MQEKPEQIAEQIMQLVSELVALSNGSIKVGRGSVKAPKEMSGATGGLRILISEKYFGDPKLLPGIIQKLKEEGRYYSSAAISMGLLNLVRERLLVRVKDKAAKKWAYVIRK